MSFTLHVDELLQYTDWQRDQWHERLRQHGDQALAVSAGLHGDGRFAVVGDLIRHIFSAEMRYVDRLCNRTLTETGGIPNNDREKLFAFGRRSRGRKISPSGSGI